MKPALRRLRVVGLVLATMAAVGGVASASTSESSTATLSRTDGAQGWSAPQPVGSPRAIAPASPAPVAPTPASPAPVAPTAASPAPVANFAGSGPDWLRELNGYRLAAGVDPVAEQTAWTAALAAHLNYLNHTDLAAQPSQYQNPHTENPASPYYTAAGAAAAESSNLTLRVWPETPVQSIDTWLSAPFHAIGLLRPDLTAVAYAAAPPWYGINVLDGLVGYGSPTAPVLFPGPDVMTTVTQWFGGVEYPNPLLTCGWQGATQGFGAPLVALLPQAPVAGLTATITGSNGQSFSTAAGNLCAVNRHNYVPDPVYGGTQTMEGPDNPVFLIYTQPLGWGRFTASISQPGQPALTWSFVATPPAKPGANTAVTLHVTDSGAQTVVGNLTVTEPSGNGYATAYPCQAGLPLASNANYTWGLTIPNHVVVHPDANGDICLYTQAGAHLIWDQVAETSAFIAGAPTRLIDTRNTGKVPAGGVVQVHVASAGEQTVIGNLTVTQPDGAGFTTVYPCTAARPLASNNNYAPGQTIPNLVVAHPDEDGNICIYAQASAHLIWDQVAATSAFSAGTASRLSDTRLTGKLPAGGVLHISGVAGPGQTVIANLTVTEPTGAGFTTVYPCTSPRPLASNNNYTPGQTIPNLVTATADANGDICVYTSQSAHLIWDQVVATSAFSTHVASRMIDTRLPEGRLAP